MKFGTSEQVLCIARAVHLMQNKKKTIFNSTLIPYMGLKCYVLQILQICTLVKASLNWQKCPHL